MSQASQELNQINRKNEDELYSRVFNNWGKQVNR